MARIALAVAGGVVGAFFGAPQIGFAIGSFLGGILFPPKLPTNYGPRLNDKQVMSSADGEPIPWGYGGFRIAGNIIWAKPMKEITTKTSTSAKGGPTQNSVTYTYVASFAVAFCEGPASVTRIWADSKLIYDVTNKQAIAIGTGITENGQAQTTRVLPNIYPGDNTQLPDPAIQADKGVNNTPAFRGICYIVFEDFPLADFGNRIPNIRAEISSGTLLEYTKDIYPAIGLPDQQDGGIHPPGPVYVNGASRLGYIFDQTGENVEVVDLSADASSPVSVWTANTVEAVGNQVLDSNGNVETATGTTGDHKTSGSAPAWTAGGFGAITHDNNVTWVNSGPGPNAITVIRKSTLDASIGKNYPVNSSFNRQWPCPGGVDTAGHICGAGVYAINGQSHGMVMRFDPTTFKVVTSIDLGAVVGDSGSLPANMNFIKLGGNDFIYWTNQQEAGGDLFIYNIQSKALSRFRFLPTGFAFGGASFAGWPCIDPATGDCYLVSYAGPSTLGITNVAVNVGAGTATYTFSRVISGNLPIIGHNGLGETLTFTGCGAGNNVIARLTSIKQNADGSGTVVVPLTTQVAGPTSGTPIANTANETWALSKVTPHGAVTNILYVGSVAGGKGMSCIFDNTDKSLLVFSGRDSGGVYGTNTTIWKVDGATGDILTQTVGTAAFREGCIICKAYNGLVPSDGVVRVPDFTSQNLVYYNASDLTIRKTVPFSNWFPLISTFQPFDFSYDAATDSMLITPVGGTYLGLAYRIFLDRQAVSAATLDTIVLDLLERSDLPPSQIDVTALAPITCLGYVIPRTSDAKSCLQPLCMAYFFDLVETDFKLKAVLRGGAVAVNIPEADLGLAQDHFKVVETIAQEQDLPKTVSVQYYDPALNYQQGKQHKYRRGRVKHTKNQSVLQLPITLTADEAAQISEKFLATVWGERNQYASKLWRASYLVLDPSDVIQFTYEGLPFQARIAKETMGQNKVLEITGVSEDARQYLSTLSGAPNLGFQGGTILPAGPTLTLLLDIPLLQDSDGSLAGNSGIYYAMTSPSTGWSGATLNQSADDQTYTEIDNDFVEATYGVVAAATPAPLHSPFSWDMDTTITVTLNTGSMSSTTELAVLNGANAFILGGEVMQCQNVVNNGNNSFTLSKLLRGRRGTEFACDTHGVGETFILLDPLSTRRVPLSTGLIGLLRYYKGVTLGTTKESVSPIQLTLAANDLKPYAPAQFTGSANGDGSISMSWIRRTRIGGAWLDGTGTVPLSEETESYDVDIMYLNFQGRSDLHYVTSPASGIGQSQLFIVGGVEQYSAIVAPFSITWDDGVTANYQGFSIPTLASSFSTPTFLWVHDPNRQGDINGTPLTYGFDHPAHGDDTQPNQPGYYLIGVIPPTLSGAPLSRYVTGVGGDAAVRTISALNVPSYTYPASQQVLDFGRNEVTATGAPGFVRARVYQNSAVAGRGFAVDNSQVGGGAIVSGGSDATSIFGVPITGTPADGDVLRYNSGTNAWEMVGPLAKRQVGTKITGSLANGSAETGTWTLGCKAMALLKVEVSGPARVTLYSTSAFRDADLRAYNQPPASGAQNGILGDFGLIAGGDEVWVASPPLLCANGDSVEASQLYYRITNLSGGTAAITVSLTFVPLEI